METHNYVANSNAVLVDSFAVLVNSLNNHANDLKDVSQLKTAREGVDYEQMVVLEQRVRVMEHTLKTLSSFLREERDAIQGVKNMRSVVQEHTTHIQNICDHFPEHLPQQQVFKSSVSIGQSETQKTSVTSVSEVEVKENVSKNMDVNRKTQGNEYSTMTQKNSIKPKTVGNKKKKKKIKCTDRIPLLKYLTVDEFSAVPSYIRGRLSLHKVNSALNELQIIVRQKYELYDKNPRKLGTRQKDILMAYKEQETPETDGRFFVTEREMRKAVGFHFIIT
jgi:hypothetical protein